MSTHISSGADEVLASTAESGSEDPLDALLRQIVGGYFVLTDGQGAVSKWSEPAELLFGRPAQEILGQSFFGTLLDPALGAEARSWRAFLEAGDPPTAAGRVSAQGLHALGRRFPIEAVFVPVKLDEGFDFSLFLEDLGFELPQNLMLLRMRQQHPVVVRALRQAIETEPAPWEGWRTAGTLVVFRPTAPTPWVQEELEAREAARAEQDAEVEDRLTNHDPGVQGSSVRDLDDAAAVVARLLSAMERIDDLERMAAALPAQVQEARRDVDSSRARAEAAEREAARLRVDLERAVEEIKQGGNDAAHLDLLARMDRLERARLDEDAARASALKAAEASRAELAQRLERAEADRARAAEAIDGRVAAAVSEATRRAEEAIEEARNRADGARTAFESRIHELETLRSGDAEARQGELTVQLERVRAEHEEAVRAARRELATTLEGIERDRERDAEAARAELHAALERVEHVQRESDALREQLTRMTVERHEAEGLAGEERRRLAELQRDAEETRARVDGLRDEARGEVAELRATTAGLSTAHEALQGKLTELRQDSGSDLEQLRAAADALRAEQQAAAAQLAALRADAGSDDAEVRRSVDELRAAHEEIAGRLTELAAEREALEEVRRAHAELAGRAHEIERAREDADQRDADILRRQDDISRRHEEVAHAQAEIGRRHVEVAAVADQLRAAQAAFEAALEQAAGERAEREQFRASTEHTLAQLAEVRAALREHESSISVQLPSSAVEHEELTAVVAELRGEAAAAVAQARAEAEALAGRLEELALADRDVAARMQAAEGAAAEAGRKLDHIAVAGEAAHTRLEQIAGTADGLISRVAGVEALADGLASRDDLAAVHEAEARTTARVEEVAGEAGAARRAAEEVAAAGQEIAARLDDAAQAGDALAARVEAVASDAAAARAGVATAAEEASRALAVAGDTAERVTEIDRGIAEVRDRVDESAAVARSAHEASISGRAETDELRGAVARVTGELQVAGGELQRAGEEALGARQAASTAQDAAAAAREDASRAHEESAAVRSEVELGRDRLSALGTSVERLTESAANSAQAAESAQAEATAARRSGNELAQLASELDRKATALRGEMGAGRERLETLDASVEQLGQASMIASRDARSATRAVEAQGAELRSELAEVRAIAERAQSGIDAILAEVARVRAQSERMVADSATHVETVVAGERRLEAMGAEVTFALESLREIKAGLSSAGQAAVLARREAEQAKKAAQNAGEGSKDNVTEVFAQLLGLAAKKGNGSPHRRSSNPVPKRPGPSDRQPRHGFDDVAQPIATLSLEGKFRELNPPFAKLVGYQEHEFGKATWPSPHDRSVYEQQQEQLAQLAAGETASVPVQSTYMHGQGLMVPVVGRLSVVRDDDGLPLHLLLEAEDRHAG